MHAILVLTLIIGLFSTSQRSGASNICSDEGGRQFILNEKFHTSLKEAVQKHLVNPKNLFSYWTQQKNISDNLDNPWDSFDLCLTEKAHQSEDSCLKKWFRFTTNFDLFINDLNHFTKCVLPNLEKDDQLRELLASLLENAYLESEKISTNVSEHMIRKSFDEDLVSSLNRNAISENERLSEKRKAARCEVLKNNMRIKIATESLSRNNSDESMVDPAHKNELENENDLDCQSNNNKTSISDQQLEYLVKDRISSICKGANLNTKDRIVCQWMNIRNRLEKFEKGSDPESVHANWLPKFSERLKTGNLNEKPIAYFNYLIDLDKYLVSSYFSIEYLAKSEVRRSYHKTILEWIVRDVSKRISVDRFSQLRIECNLLRNIESVGFHEVSNRICLELDESARSILSNSQVFERVSKEINASKKLKEFARDADDMLRMLSGRPTRYQLNTFPFPNQFRSPREAAGFTAQIYQDENNLLLLERYLETENQLNDLSWILKVVGQIKSEVDSINCQTIPLLISRLASQETMFKYLDSFGGFVRKDCSDESIPNLWQALGFTYYFQNRPISSYRFDSADGNASSNELGDFSKLTLAIALRQFMFDQVGVDLKSEMAIKKMKISGATQSLVDWILDRKFQFNVDEIEASRREISESSTDQIVKDPLISELREILAKDVK